VVLDGGASILVPAGDEIALAEALASLAESPEQARRLGEARPGATAALLFDRQDGRRYSCCTAS
jgi:glycosyltransferase involved in cell wall biosynthesis